MREGHLSSIARCQNATPKNGAGIFREHNLGLSICLISSYGCYRLILSPDAFVSQHPVEKMYFFFLFFIFSVL